MASPGARGNTVRSLSVKVGARAVCPNTLALSSRGNNPAGILASPTRRSSAVSPGALVVGVPDIRLDTLPLSSSIVGVAVGAAASSQGIMQSDVSAGRDDGTQPLFSQAAATGDHNAGNIWSLGFFRDIADTLRTLVSGMGETIAFPLSIVSGGRIQATVVRTLAGANNAAILPIVQGGGTRGAVTLPDLAGGGGGDGAVVTIDGSNSTVTQGAPVGGTVGANSVHNNNYINYGNSFNIFFNICPGRDEQAQDDAGEGGWWESMLPRLLSVTGVITDSLATTATVRDRQRAAAASGREISFLLGVGALYAAGMIEVAVAYWVSRDPPARRGTGKLIFFASFLPLLLGAIALLNK